MKQEICLRLLLTGNISSKLIDLTSKADELEGQVQDALGGIGNVENYAKAMKKVTSELESAIKTAVDNGKMDRSKLTEFQNASSKLDAIVSNPEETTTNKAELLKIRESLVALASEASAGNEVIDGLAQNDKKTAQPTVKSEDLTSLVNAYTTLQNTASQLYEKGNITEKQYTEILNLGMDVSKLQEKANKGEKEDSVNSEAKKLAGKVEKLANKIK